MKKLFLLLALLAAPLCGLRAVNTPNSNVTKNAATNVLNDPLVVGPGGGNITIASGGNLTIENGANVTGLPGGAWGTITGNLSAQSDLTSALAGKVSNTRLVAGKSLSSDVTLTASDVGAVSTARTVNGHALSGDVAVTLGDLGVKSPAAFSLSDLAWTAAFDAGTLPVVSDATAISSWADLSGHGNNAVQATGGAQPAYKIAANGINGRPVVRFASGKYMQTVAGAASLTTDYYIAAVVKWSSLSGTQTIFAWGEEATGKRREILKTADSGWPTPQQNVLEANGYAADVQSLYKVQTGTPYLVEVIRSSGVITIFVNGTQVVFGSPSLNAYATTALTLGANNAGGENLVGDIGFVGVMGSAPDGATLSKFRGYVKSAYGIAVVGAEAVDSMVAFTAAGGQRSTALQDDGTRIRYENRRLYGASNAYNSEHYLSANQPTGAVDGKGLNVLKLQQFNPAGYSVVYGISYDSDPNGEGKGFAAGYGNANAVFPFGGSAFFEGYDGGSTTFVPIRFTQTISTGAYLRFQIDGPTGDFIFYQRDTAGTFATITLRIKADGSGVQLNGGPRWCSGAGSPEGAVTAPVGSMYCRTDGGTSTTLYVKESGTGNTGWVAK